MGERYVTHYGGEWSQARKVPDSDVRLSKDTALVRSSRGPRGWAIVTRSREPESEVLGLRPTSCVTLNKSPSPLSITFLFAKWSSIALTWYNYAGGFVCVMSLSPYATDDESEA